MRRLVEGRADDLALDRAGHVGDLLGPLVDQQHDQVDFGVVGRQRMRDVLQHHGLAGARRRHDQRALALAERRDQVEHPGRQVLLGRIVEFELDLLFGIERRQIVEIDPVAQPVGLLEIDAVDLEQREIALAVARRADLALDRVAGAQAEAPHLVRADIDVVRAGQVIRLGRAQKAEAVRQHFEHAVAGDRHVVLGELLQDREHHVLLAQGRGVLDLQLFGKSEQLGRSLPLEFLEIHGCLRRDEGRIGPSSGGLPAAESGRRRVIFGFIGKVCRENRLAVWRFP